MYIGLKTNSAYKTANISPLMNLNTNPKVGYLKYQREKMKAYIPALD